MDSLTIADVEVMRKHMLTAHELYPLTPGRIRALCDLALRALSPQEAEREKVQGDNGRNYVADHNTYPQEIRFSNGRIVRMKGTGYLYVE